MDDHPCSSSTCLHPDVFKANHLRPLAAVLMSTATALTSKKSCRKCEMCITCKWQRVASDRGCPLKNSHLRVFTMLPPMYNLWGVHHNSNISKHRRRLGNIWIKKDEKKRAEVLDAVAASCFRCQAVQVRKDCICIGL